MCQTILPTQTHTRNEQAQKESDKQPQNSVKLFSGHGVLLFDVGDKIEEFELK